GHGLDRGELGVAVEPVAGLALEGGRAGAEHPLRVAAHGDGELSVGAVTGRPNRGKNSAPGRVQLLVARATGAQGELLDAVAEKGRMRVAVDEARDRAKAGAVELLDLSVDGEVAHWPGGRHGAALAEHEGVLDHLELPQGSPT